MSKANLLIELESPKFKMIIKTLATKKGLSMKDYIHQVLYSNKEFAKEYEGVHNCLPLNSIEEDNKI